MSDRIWVWGANNAGQLGLGYLSEQVSSPTEQILPSKYSVDTRHVKDDPEYLSHSESEPDKSGATVKQTVVAIQGGGSHTVILLRCQSSEAKKDRTRSSNFYDESDSIGVQDRELWYEVVNYGLISTKQEFPTESTCFPPQKVNGLLRTPQIACGWDFTLFLNSEGQLFSCGDNYYGQLGRNGECNMTYAPVSVGGVPCIGVSAGLRHAAAIFEVSEETSYVMVWGDNSKKQLGLLNSTTAIVKEPTRIILRDRRQESVIPVKVRCGKNFTIVLASDGFFYGCGLDKFGIFGRESVNGNGKRKSAYLPEFTQLELSYPADCCIKVKDFQCGWNHVLVLLENGRILSWGRNNFYQLGRSASQNLSACDYDWMPKYVNEGLPDYKPDPVISIACGSEHNLALTKSGQVYAWGWNEHDNCGITIKNSETGHVIKIPTLVLHVDSSGNPKLDSGAVLIGCGAGNSFTVTSASQ